MRRTFFTSAVLAGALVFGFSPTAHAQDQGGNGGNGGNNQGGDNGGRPNGGGDNGGGGGRRGGGRGGRGGGFNLVDQLKEQLGLTDDQIAKITAIQDDLRNEMRKARDNQDGGGFDPQKMREEMQARMEKMRGQVRELLNKDQQAKFDQFMKDQEARRGQGGFGGPGGPGGPRGDDPERQAKRLYDQAAQDLKLSDEEKSAVLPLVKKVLDARATARAQSEKRKQDFSAFVKTKGASDAEKDEISAKLKELRKAGDDDQAKIKEAQVALREVLTVDNEARLVALGVLD